MNSKTIALAGNPNVGKSTVFNSLTGLNQHTGNWPGKTVTNAQGRFTYNGTEFLLIDLPGTYSLSATSPDETVARDYICSGEADLILVVADATCLERNLNLVLQISSITKNVLLCVNLLDEARKKKISVDLSRLSSMLNIPVIGMAARSGEGRETLLSKLYDLTLEDKELCKCCSLCQSEGEAPERSASAEWMEKAKHIYTSCVSHETEEPHRFDRKLDTVVTSRLWGYPVMCLLLALIFWITISGANYPSQWLTALFAHLDGLLRQIPLPEFLTGPVIDGIYKTTAWVVSVMLPPMAIFFPLFTLLEDFGYLPRIAFNMDHAFHRCSAHGKQSLTMCMGFGCNACGVIGCRIIESPRERLIAILTNNFVPCNGRFPTLIAVITMFFTVSFPFGKGLWSCFLLLLMIILGIAMTFFVSKVLSKTILKGLPSSFILELPPYRRPKFGDVIVRSILDRTLFVLSRAIIVAAPAGLIIWVLANIQTGHTTLLACCTDFLQPFGALLGVDGVIIMAFLLGFPANEIVIPIILMAYMANGALTDYSSLEQLHTVLTDNGWTWQTALSTMILCLFHFPCGTTCLTIKRETGSWKWTGFAILLPTIIGLLLCFLLNCAVQLISM